MSATTRESVTRQAAEPRLDGLTPASVGLLQKAAHAIRDGAAASALKALNSAMAQSPGHPEVLRLFSILHTRAQRHADAINALQQALTQWPDYALAHSDLGNAQQATGDMTAAFASWRRACSLAPTAPMPWFNLGRNLQQHGDTDAAITALQTAHQLAPDFLPALILL
ncbi:MAG: tetratricopeptide repeat protein, partial [Pseudomonadota bacterium]|nr:tetratricopeptide repeat protein [Pseudomonadota bacterium]